MDLGCEFVMELIIEMSVHEVYQYFDLSLNQFKCMLILMEVGVSLQHQSNYWFTYMARFLQFSNQLITRQ